jgi:hypothetical protein
MSLKDKFWVCAEMAEPGLDACACSTNPNPSLREERKYPYQCFKRDELWLPQLLLSLC